MCDTHDPSTTPSATPSAPPTQAPVRCPNCGDIPSPEDSSEFSCGPDGEPICSACMEDTGTCPGCDTLFWSTELTPARPSCGGRRIGTAHYCSSCIFTCDGCSNDFYGEEYGFNGNSYCSSCYDEITGCCDRCENVEDRDDLHGFDGGLYCTYCYDIVSNSDDDDDGDGEGRRGDDLRAAHDYKPRPVFASLTRDEIDFSVSPCRGVAYYGLEVEVEYPVGWDNRSATPVLQMALDAGQNRWYLKKDGSLVCGAEFVSHPATIGYWRKVGVPWVEILRSRNFRAWKTNTCGLHIHVSRSALTPNEWYRMALFFRDNLSFVLRLARRPLNTYCDLDPREPVPLLVRKVRPGAPKTFSRYQALNFQPLNTVEFRLFAGTLNGDSIIRNIEAVNSLFHFVRQHPHTKMKEPLYLDWLRTKAVSLPDIGHRVNSVRKLVDPIFVSTNTVISTGTNHEA